MTTVTLKINERSKAGKLMTELLELMKKQPGIEVINEKSTYNPEFVRKIKKSEQHIKVGKGIEMTSATKLWDSL